MSILPEGEQLRKAVKWVSDERTEHPGVIGTTNCRISGEELPIGVHLLTSGHFYKPIPNPHSPTP
jgi:hypothetical protein